MMVLTNNKKTFWPGLLVFLWLTATVLGGHTKNIVLTGYWPPTNDMMRKFSTNLSQNPGGWQGGNWEGRGYDIYAFFPEFPGGTGSNPKGNGDFEVDYQDVGSWSPPAAPTGDFWRITNQYHPVAILSFGNGNGPWEIEYNARNLSGWAGDYLSPTQPTPAPPDSSVPVGYVRRSTLPCQAIADAVNASGLGVDAWVDWNGNPGAFLCEYMAYHNGWYQSLHSNPDGPYYCAAAGFTHVSGGVTVSKATQALEIALRTTITYLDSVISPRYDLTVTVSGNGSVAIDPDLPSYDVNSVVTLTAIADDSSEFFRWIGDIQSTDNPLAVTLNSNKQITACFTNKPVLIVDVVGDGTVQIEPDLPYYQWDSEVTLTAQADSGSFFSNWGGDIIDANNPVTVVMDSDKHITVVFADSSVTLIDSESFEGNWPPVNWNINGEWTKNNTRSYNGIYSAGFKHIGASQWTLLTYDDFEAGFGNYTDGGSDCGLYTYLSGTNYAHQGSKAANIQDDSGEASSFYLTDGIDVDTPGYTSIKIDFWFYPLSMEAGEDFFIEYYDGTGWRVVGQYISGTNFVNGQFYHQTVYVNKSDYTFPANMKIRFRCDASADGDDIYIDEVKIEALSYASSLGSGYLEAPALDCSDSVETYVEFWYYTTVSDGNSLLQCYDGNSWNTIADLTTLPTDQWNHYENTLTDSKYQTSNFRLRWLTSDVGSGESFYVDMVTVKKTVAFVPIINQQPVNQSLLPGATARFDIVAIGSGTISYTWQSDVGGGWYDIQSAISSALEINDINDIDIGNYRCLVSNEYGITNSDIAALRFGDLDGIDPVDFGDFVILAADWGKNISSPGDINRDGITDFQDIAILVRSWLYDFGQE